MQTQSEQRFATESIPKLMVTMAVPSVIAQVINILYNIVDRIYIGHIEGVGAAALTGVGVTFPIITLISAFSAFVGRGGAPLAAIWMGKGDQKHAEKILGKRRVSADGIQRAFDGGVPDLAEAASVSVRGQRRHDRICLRLSDHLSAWNLVCPAGAGAEPVYHLSGKAEDGHAFHRDRGGDQYCSGSDLYLRIRLGRAGSGHCHGDLPGHERGLERGLSGEREILHPSDAAESEAGAQDHRADLFAGNLSLYHELHGKPCHHRVKQRHAEVRRGICMWAPSPSCRACCSCSPRR